VASREPNLRPFLRGSREPISPPLGAVAVAMVKMSANPLMGCVVYVCLLILFLSPLSVLGVDGVDETALKAAEEAQAEHEAAPEPVVAQVVDAAPEVELHSGDGDINTAGTW